MKLGNNLRTLRKQRGLTQAALADRVEVSRKTINTVENSVFVPSTLLALSLAKTLEVAVEDIFFLKPEVAADEPNA